MARRAPKTTTIIRREEIIEGGHHGGAWKVAYADFVTAMMAFFLLMWLLNATTEEQRRGIADYFSSVMINNKGQSGSGHPFGGTSPFVDGPSVSDRGTIAVMSNNVPPTDVEDDGSDTLAKPAVHRELKDGPGQARDAPDHPSELGPLGATEARQRLIEARRQEQAELAKAAFDLQKAFANDPQLALVARQLSVDLTPEGLRVQIRDADGQEMFAQGSAEPNERARAVLLRLAPALIALHEKISIAGYTDATPYLGGGRTNWDLSADRANATRRVLVEAGLDDSRIRDVTGHADRDPLLPATPSAAANRRIAILLARTQAVGASAAR